MDLIEVSCNENRHPWELSRTTQLLHIVTALCRKIRSADADKSILIADIGAGDLYFDYCVLAEIRNIHITAVDMNFQSLDSPDARIRKTADIRQLEDYQYDIIIMMDVLEHVADDAVFIKEIERKLKDADPRYLIITVPAFQHLFSTHDVFLKHYRRYEKSSLEKLIVSNVSLSISAIHYFYTSLYFIRLFQKIIRKIRGNQNVALKQSGIGTWKYSKTHIITKLITLFLNGDYRLNRWARKFGIIFPGLSLLAVLCGRKEAGHER
ncbi:MAG: class I SAM-dependent methyltransferase [Treponema sp.]|jgi:ubiquinone/menaquinone biosynthesis C-methylase UbiE|nr:class I SAM-dependent methyltransferase [Treponema sp.]